MNSEKKCSCPPDKFRQMPYAEGTKCKKCGGLLLTNEIFHVNPNCLDSKYCLPHGEEGKVEYDIDKMLEYIQRLENKRYLLCESLVYKTLNGKVIELFIDGEEWKKK